MSRSMLLVLSILGMSRASGAIRYLIKLPRYRV